MKEDKTFWNIDGKSETQPKQLDINQTSAWSKKTIGSRIYSEK